MAEFCFSNAGLFKGDLGCAMTCLQQYLKIQEADDLTALRACRKILH